MSDAADALGFSKPFLYHCLQNKDEMLFECSRVALAQLHAMLDEARRADVPGWNKLRLEAVGRPASFAIFGAYSWITHWYRDDGPLPPDEVAERFPDIFAQGAQARRGSAR